MMRWACFVAMFALIAPAQDADTERLSRDLRAARSWLTLTVPQFRLIQQDLLEWTDSRIKRGLTEDQLNAELARAGLFAPEALYQSGDILQPFPGYLDTIEIEPVPGADDLISIKLPIGMTCNFDDTVVIYRRETRERLGWLHNRDTEGSIAWNVQALQAGVMNGTRVVAAGLMSGWCTSTVVGASLHLWTIEGDRLVPNVTLNRGARRWDENPIAITLDDRSVTFRYRANVWDTIVISYRVHERYELVDGRATRIAPLTTSVGGFFREWLDANLPSWKGQLVEFNRILHCPGTSRLWQIDATRYESNDRRIFLIEENGAEKLQMLGTRSTMLRDCPEASLEQLVAELPVTN